VAKYKCKYCKEKDDEISLVTEIIEGKRQKDHKDGKWKKGDKYERKVRYHQSCHDKQKRENREWDDCYNTILDAHGAEVIPPSFVGLLQRLRNGNPITGMRKGDTKHFKQGFPYPVIAECYRQKKDLILWKKRQWDGSDGKFFHFVLSFYILDIINGVNYKMENEKLVKQKEEQQSQLAKDYYDEDEEWTFNNEKNKNDISDLLG